jgi:hypothetical protein
MSHEDAIAGFQPRPPSRCGPASAPLAGGLENRVSGIRARPNVSEARDGSVKRNAAMAKRCLEAWLRYQTTDPASEATDAHDKQALWLRNRWTLDHPEWPTDDVDRMMDFPCSHTPEESDEWARWMTAVAPEFSAAFFDAANQRRRTSCEIQSP